MRTTSNQPPIWLDPRNVVKTQNSYFLNIISDVIFCLHTCLGNLSPSDFKISELSQEKVTPADHNIWSKNLAIHSFFSNCVDIQNKPL